MLLSLSVLCFFVVVSVVFFCPVSGSSCVLLAFLLSFLLVVLSAFFISLFFIVFCVVRRVVFCGGVLY